ncbi:MAG TPA: nickel pincer cofactor biosynthesis protein LarC [Armatimonadota bacterium]|jgi:hypothetical protein
MVAYFDCFSGIAGDMTVAALLDAGLDWDALRAALAQLPLDGYELRRSTVSRSAISATHFDVVIDAETAHQHGRHLADIEAMIVASGLPQPVQDHAKAIFRRLGDAEAHVHGAPIETIHFHEVGAVDSIIDIVGTCVGLHLLGITRILASPLPVGHGMVRTAHGLMPIPAPATAELCKGIPTYPVDVEGELVTPTGAAILATLADGFGPPPPLAATAVGYGAGTKDFGERPNLLRVTLADDAPAAGWISEQLTLLETNIDDMNPQIYEDIMDRCFAAGALDVTLTPIQMKKNRPAVTLAILCEPGKKDALLDTLFRRTTSLGIRVSQVERLSLPREIIDVQTEFGAVKVKVAHLPGGGRKAHAEYESAKAVANESGANLLEVMRAAEEGARS